MPWIGGVEAGRTVLDREQPVAREVLAFAQLGAGKPLGRKPFDGVAVEGHDAELHAAGIEPRLPRIKAERRLARRAVPYRVRRADVFSLGSEAKYRRCAPPCCA